MRQLAIVVPLLLLVGCAHRQLAYSESPGTTVAAKPVAGVAASPPEPTCSNDAECKAGQLCVRGACVDISDSLAECNQLRVHFALNSSDIDPGDRRALERSARCLKRDHALHVSIEGNADERGTEEYNLALGDRRATAVAKYLEALGASGSQLKTVSYGKEKPLCIEHDEDCWAKNRRAEVTAANGPATTTKPRAR